MSSKKKDSATTRQVSIFDSLLKKIIPGSEISDSTCKSAQLNQEKDDISEKKSNQQDFTPATDKLTQSSQPYINKSYINNESSATPELKATEKAASKNSKNIEFFDDSSENQNVIQKVRSDFFRLAAFAANICEAHSAFIFLPYDALCALIGKAPPAVIEERKALVLVGFQSLSKDSVINDARLPSGYGIIGWAARHKKAVHVSPFQLDVRTLGLYSDKQELKSLTARPISLSHKISTECGVLVCDSKKTYAFSRIHERLLDNLSFEISNTVALLLDRQHSQQPAVMWNNFVSKASEIRQSLGETSIEILRVSIENPAQLEGLVGTQEFTNLAEQLYRLTMQSLPPHIPAIRLINGDLVIFLDSMMSSFYESRLKAICERLTKSKVSFRLVFRRVSARDKNLQSASLSELVAASAIAEEKVFDKEKKYGNS